MITDAMLGELRVRLKTESGARDRYMVRMWRHALDRAAAALAGEPEQRERDSIPYLPVEPEELGLLMGAESRLLDVGCLGGYGLFDLTWRRVRAGRSVPSLVGVDVDESSLAFGARMLPVWNRGWKVDFIRADSSRLPFEDAGFDLVIAKLVLPYAPVRPTLGELVRVCRAGGLVILQTQSAGYYWRRALRALPRVDRFAYFIRAITAGACLAGTGRQFANRWFSETCMSSGTLKKICVPLGLCPVRDVGNADKPMIVFVRGRQ